MLGKLIGLHVILSPLPPYFVVAFLNPKVHGVKLREITREG